MNGDEDYVSSEEVLEQFMDYLTICFLCSNHKGMSTGNRKDFSCNN